MSTTTSRRRFLRIAGSAAVILAAGSGAWIATRTPSGALKPWRDASSAAQDPRLRAFAYAILSPNPHNMQPWRVDLSEAGAATLFVDLDRRLPETDPFDRQVTIGLGCFLETLRIAAAQDGLSAEITPFPDGEAADRLDARAIARIAFTPGGAPDPLFAQILERRTVKEPYAPDAPPDDALRRVAAAIETSSVTTRFETAPDRVAALNDLMWRGHERESLTPRAFEESVRVMRIGRAEIEANPDGIDLGGPMLEALSVAGLLSREQIRDPASTAFAEGMRRYQEMLAATPAQIIMTTEGNDRRAQLDVGRAWMRAHLQATAEGIDLHPISQTLQEYPEIRDLFEEAQAALRPTPTATAQMLGRVGYGPEQAPSPRWPISAKLL